MVGAHDTEPGGAKNEFQGVAAIATDDVWAVGYDETSSPARNLAAHWDGHHWSIVTTPNIRGGSPADNKLQAVAAVNHGDVWAVGWENNIGGSNKQQTITMQWNGTKWTVVDSPDDTLTTTPLGAAAVAGGTVWAVGATEHAGHCCLRTLVLQTNNG